MVSSMGEYMAPGSYTAANPDQPDKAARCSALCSAVGYEEDGRWGSLTCGGDESWYESR